MPATFRRRMFQLVSTRVRVSVVVSALVLGLLFWARLIVIADMPRTAIADEDAPASAQAADSDSDKDDATSDDLRTESDAQRDTLAHGE